MPKIRAALLGYGRTAGQMHAAAIERHATDFEIAAVCDADAARLEDAAQRHQCAVYADYREMLKKETLDLVCVLTRSDQHCAMTCDCLAAGVHVLVTKPWAVNLAEARRLFDLSEKSDRLLLPFLPARWGCDFRRLKQLLAEKTIGEVFLIRRAASSFARRDDWQTRRRYGGGALLNWGPHLIDPACLLAGGKAATVYGRTRRILAGGDCEDFFFAVLQMADGPIVQVEYSVSAEELPAWFIQGDGGSIEVRGRNLKIVRKTPAQPSDPTQVNAMKGDAGEVRQETLEGELFGDAAEIYAEAAGAIRGRQAFPVVPADALRLSEITEAIHLSSEENRVVQLLLETHAC